MQVHRTVIQLKRKQGMLIDGVKATTTPLGNIGSKNIPRLLTTESIHSRPQAVS